MHFKKRNLIIWLTALCLFLSLTGCSSVSDKSKETFNNTPSESFTYPIPSEPEVIPLFDPVPPVKLVEYTGPKYHIFFHSLIAFPDIAFSKAAGNGSFDTDCVTVNEFKKTLEELYKNGYILIDIHSTFETVEENGKQVLKDKKLMLPEGKKPLIMSVDDMVYDPVKMGLGMVDKIILDDKGEFATYTKMKDGKEIISHDNEIIPILEQFVKEHPDFSFNGAKATLALTGWVGVLGYRIDRLASNQQSEIEAVKPIIKKLKESGWTMSSHGYGHRHSNQISYGLFADDTQKWHNEIEPVVGPVDVYVYPYGEKLAVTDPKYKLLLQYGFKLICGVDNRPVWTNYGDSIFMNRQAIDGYSLRNYHQSLLPYLDTQKVFDAESRKLH